MKLVRYVLISSAGARPETATMSPRHAACMFTCRFRVSISMLLAGF